MTDRRLAGRFDLNLDACRFGSGEGNLDVVPRRARKHVGAGVMVDEHERDQCGAIGFIFCLGDDDFCHLPESSLVKSHRYMAAIELCQWGWFGPIWAVST